MRAFAILTKAAFRLRPGLKGAAVQHYWDTVNAPFPWPWEIWEVKG